MEVERLAGALYTTFLVDLSGARALEFHGLYCWYLSGLDTLSVGNVLGRLLPHSRGFGAMVFPPPVFVFSFSHTLHNPTALLSESKASHHDLRITGQRKSLTILASGRRRLPYQVCIQVSLIGWSAAFIRLVAMSGFSVFFLTD
jgi:hypothetical protein